MSNPKNQIKVEEVGKSLGLVTKDTETAIDEIKRDILLTLRGKNPRLDARLEKVYKEWYPEGLWNPTPSPILSTMLLGPPGQGKTTAFKEAGRQVAGALGMNFLLNPADDQPVGDNDFLFISQEFSAETSKMEIGGIPAKHTDADGTEYMVKLFNRRIAMLNKAGGGLFLLDDFPNASANIQNIGLSITEEKRFQGLSLTGVYVALTGNLGAIDGTHTSRISTALRGRVRTFYTYDRLKNFIARTHARFRDDVGDAGATLFLSRFEQYFMSMPDPKQSGGFVSPRTWDKFIDQSRQFIFDVGGRGNAMKALTKIRDEASCLLGPEVGTEVYSFYHSMLQDADPLARLLIQEGKMDTERFKKHFDAGLNSKEQHFAYQFASALSDYTVNAIIKGGDSVFDETIKRFAMGATRLYQDSYAYALDALSNQLASKIESLSNKQASRYILKTEVKTRIAKILQQDQHFNNDHRQIVIDTLSEMSKAETQAPRGRSRRKN